MPDLFKGEDPVTRIEGETDIGTATGTVIGLTDGGIGTGTGTMTGTVMVDEDLVIESMRVTKGTQKKIKLKNQQM